MNARFRLSIRPTTFLISLLLLPSLVLADEFAGKVTAVTDGDTIEIMRGGQPVKVRLHGIDCPEKGQDWGTKAKQFTSGRCFGKEVTVQVKDMDRYGRTVGNVILPNGKSLNQAIVAAGFAWWYQRYAPGDATLQRLENEARGAKRGVWSHPNPVAPWEHRRQKRSRRAAASSQTKPQHQVPAQSTAGTVYITKTGKKYHSGGCQYLSKSQIPISLGDAKARGYTLCSRCAPPR